MLNAPEARGGVRAAFFKQFETIQKGDSYTIKRSLLYNDLKWQKH
jgi:hypothetical protein